MFGFKRLFRPAYKASCSSTLLKNHAAIPKNITQIPLLQNQNIANGAYLHETVRHFIRRLKRKTGGGLNTHRSNRAKEGLYHGKDIRSGNTISHSHKRTKRKFYPNVQNKRLWSESLESWVRFKMTTAALKAIDSYGGIDNYLLSLDEPSVQDGPHILKMRNLVARSKFHDGTLKEKIARRHGFHKETPEPVRREEIPNSKKMIPGIKSQRKHTRRNAEANESFGTGPMKQVDL